MKGKGWLVTAVSVISLAVLFAGNTLAEENLETKEENAVTVAGTDETAADPYEKDDHYKKGRHYLREGKEELAARQFKLSAQDGYAMGSYELGCCYESARGVKKSYHQAFKYYMLAAERGHAGAMAALGRCYLWGRGGVIDKDKAFEWFLRSAENGDSAGQLWTGYCYQHGVGTQQNKETAREYYKLSLAQGNLMALDRMESLGI